MFQEFYLPPLLVVFAPAFTLGFLHTAIPCEDKAIFFFWSFGISKTPLRSVLILVLYGLGLMSSNLIIAFVTVAVSFLPQIFIPGIIPDDFTINFFGAVVSMFAGIILLFFITRRKYMPHSKYKDELSELNWEKKKTPYLFGILAGFAPCIFELIIYTQCLQYSLSGIFIDGIFIVFYFSLGTFVGLFPLALAKHGTSQILKTREPKPNRVLLIMILILILFNAAVMILSFLRIRVFPEVSF
ncbi:MAG: sulfite exporter TauE/SafE family protein [Candidatus Lokiarchaeota archaeon]|nr:sulfite exporter TauE/SafE family protein [Candidatus Lokiarchaeota archaeon]